MGTVYSLLWVMQDVYHQLYPCPPHCQRCRRSCGTRRTPTTLMLRVKHHSFRPFYADVAELFWGPFA